MSLFTKEFWIGIVVGIALTGLLVAGLVGGLMYMSFKMAGEFSRGESGERKLPGLTFPETSRLTAYGEADWDWSFTSLDGQPAKLGDLQGKVLFINFWATWCGPCMAEMPAIQKLHEALQGERVAVLLLSDEDADTVRKFAEKREYDLPFYLYTGQPPGPFRTRGIPATFVVAPEGEIVYKHTGAAQWDDEACIAFLRSLLPSPEQN